MSVRVRHLRKSYGAHVAADDIDLAVPEGHMLVLLGPSGCGKTTTMRCIAGLETPDTGLVEVGGQIVFDAERRIDVPVNRRRIGMVFQSYAIWPHMSVFDNVAFPLQMEGVSRQETASRVNEMLDRVGLAGLASRGASMLSGGQMQRVALARSLVMRPTLLLFDEPLSNVDARLRDQLRVLLRELQLQLGITGIYVTHDQSEAFALADQVAVMSHGRFRQLTDPETLYRRPATSEIARFIGYSNIFPGRLLGQQDGACVIGLQAGVLRTRNAPEDPQLAFDVCVRPDAVRLLPPDATGENCMSGEITLVSFMGAHRQIRVRVAGGAVWEALDPMTCPHARVGAKTLLQIDPAQVLCLPGQ